MISLKCKYYHVSLFLILYGSSNLLRLEESESLVCNRSLLIYNLQLLLIFLPLSSCNSTAISKMLHSIYTVLHVLCILLTLRHFSFLTSINFLSPAHSYPSESHTHTDTHTHTHTLHLDQYSCFFKISLTLGEDSPMTKPLKILSSHMF